MKQATYRSSITGRYVTRAYAEANPRITVKETERGVEHAVQIGEAEEVPIREEAGGSEEVREAREEEAL